MALILSPVLILGGVATPNGSNNGNIVPAADAQQAAAFDISIYPIQSGSDMRAVIQEHSASVKYVWNFRLEALDKFPNDEHVLMEQSLAHIRTSISTEIPRSGVDVATIAYDLEASNGDLSSPPSEVAAAASSINTAMDLIHAAGYDSAVGPTRRILWDAYEDVQWRKVDTLGLQMQKVIGLRQYDDIMNDMLPFIKAQNPDIQVVVQVAPRLFSNTAIVNQIQEHKDKVDVVMIMWDLSDERILDDLLTKLEAIR